MGHPLWRAGILLLGIACASGTAAQAYPSKLIRIIIPFPPGNTLDIKSDFAKYGELIRDIGFQPQ